MLMIMRLECLRGMAMLMRFQAVQHMVVMVIAEITVMIVRVGVLVRVLMGVTVTVFVAVHQVAMAMFVAVRVDVLMGMNVAMLMAAVHPGPPRTRCRIQPRRAGHRQPC